MLSNGGGGVPPYHNRRYYFRKCRNAWGGTQSQEERSQKRITNNHLHTVSPSRCNTDRPVRNSRPRSAKGWGCLPLGSPYSTHRTRLQCVHVDPTGPVFWPRLTRTLGSCSPRSHPSSHALFRHGTSIVLPTSVRHSSNRFFDNVFLVCSTHQWYRCFIESVPRRDETLVSAKASGSHRSETDERGQKFNDEAPRDVSRVRRTVAPRHGFNCKLAPWTRGWLPPPSIDIPLPASATRTRCAVSGIGSIGDFNGLIGKKGCVRPPAATIGTPFSASAHLCLSVVFLCLTPLLVIPFPFFWFLMLVW